MTGVDHYENFPVASRLMPARMRPAVVAIYRFARYADDVADEGDARPDQRLRELQRLRDSLAAGTQAQHPIVLQLQPFLVQHQIPTDPLHALLSAFEQDVTVHRFRDHAMVLDYCRRSANPVGQLILHLFGARNERTEPLSDAICTALQLINFLQDLAIDWTRGRLYLPLNELALAGLDETTIEHAVSSGRSPPPLRAVIQAQGRRAHALLESGASLPGLVPMRLALELRAIIAGGRRILESLAAEGWDPIARRPKLGWRDAPALLRLMIADRHSL